jgi:hypothetical protein
MQAGVSPAEVSNGRNGIVAWMIDHGHAFNGSAWNYKSAFSGVYFRSGVYHAAHTWRDFQPWLDRIISFPERVLEQAVRSLPTEWLQDDAAELHLLLEGLLRRRLEVPELISRCIEARPTFFPNWRL